MTKKYFKWKRLENSICKIFQGYIENERWCKSFLEQRENLQASVDFLGRLYDKENNKTIVDLAVEVRSLEQSKEDIENKYKLIPFPISKLNELMKFWRMWKEVYILYLLKDKVFFLNWAYYLKHNFEIKESKKWYFIKLPIINFIYCWDYKKLD